MKPVNTTGDITAKQALQAIKEYGCQWLLFGKKAGKLVKFFGKNIITLTCKSELSSEHVGGEDAFFHRRDPHPEEEWGVSARTRDIILGTNTEDEIKNDERFQLLIGKFVANVDELVDKI